MATSLLSLALNHPLDPTIAMTGELTVTGKVLRIGGLREKTVAARRAGATKIIFPADNMSDWLELPEVSFACFLFSSFLVFYSVSNWCRTSNVVSRAIRPPGTPMSLISSSPISTRERPTRSGARSWQSPPRRRPMRTSTTIK